MSGLVEITGKLVAAQASNTPMTTEQILSEINKVHAALRKLEAGQPAEVPEERKPTLTFREAFRKDQVVCMECGKGGFKTLTRHLKTAHGMKPGEYRKKFGIPTKTPLSAKKYSEERRKSAQERNLAGHLAKARAVRMEKIEKRRSAVLVGNPMVPV